MNVGRLIKNTFPNKNLHIFIFYLLKKSPLKLILSFDRYISFQ